MEDLQLGLFSKFANLVGASEPALRLLISLVIGYPLLYIHKKYLKECPPFLQHMFFIFGGIGIALFNSEFTMEQHFEGFPQSSNSIPSSEEENIKKDCKLKGCTNKLDEYDAHDKCVIHRKCILRSSLSYAPDDCETCQSLLTDQEGTNVVHSMICIVSAWLVLLLIGGTLCSVVITFIFQMGYLLTAYYLTGTDTYDIKWTMPQCVLTLRLIGLAFDLYDGNKKTDTLSNDQKKTALKNCPSIVEIASLTYFPPSFMVGPQFSMKRYQDFISQSLYPKDTPSPEMIGLTRGLWGIFYLIIFQLGTSYIPDSYLISVQFINSPFWKKMVIMGVWGKITLYKYISCWLITEGACIYSGLAYSGSDIKGNPLWKGCANVKVKLFETGILFGELIKGFNTNTNEWVAQYIYKRLKFLNNRYLSQSGALFFLALWHGFHSGYYACFFMEFIIMYSERDCASLLNKFPQFVTKVNSPPLIYVKFILMKLYVIVFMGYCLSSFVLLKSSRWWGFYVSVNFVGHVFFLGWHLYKPLLKLFLEKYGGPRLPRKIDGVGQNSSKKEM